ncbi:MAG: aminotransferase class V-fold PLP-dependent enzyme [Thermoplasmatota archaeon]
MKQLTLDFIRENIIGNDIIIDTPFGRRHMLYADYTASGRALAIIEEQLQNILKSYANTHTEDDYSGQFLTTLLYQAEEKIKDIVNAREHDKIILTGSGATGALKKLQEIIGVYLPPATKKRLKDSISSSKHSEKILQKMKQSQPVVFIGPYEHHTNELMWREALVEVQVIPFDKTGMIDLKILDKKLKDPRYKNRAKYASFSAGSNVTGIRTNVYDIACLCHQNDTFVFFDFAAVAPYIEINMNKDETSYFDAIFFSPHKFLGGPATSGILVFNEKLYQNNLPPTCAAGGTVRYVGFNHQIYSDDIETREKAGTPPIIQTIKAALVLDVKENIGIDIIEKKEQEYGSKVLEKLKANTDILLMGDIPAEKRVSIISFNIKHDDRFLHSRFVTTLLNDLFGIQSRAGCSCAGPYGHVLLGIDEENAERCSELITQCYEGIKQGWIRINIHYTLSQEDVDYILKAIEFIAEYGYLFLHLYSFDIKTGDWAYIDYEKQKPSLSIHANFKPDHIDLSTLASLRESYFNEAIKQVEKLQKKKTKPYIVDCEEIEEIKKFYYQNKA